jgi:hypothetical protein
MSVDMCPQDLLALASMKYDLLWSNLSSIDEDW